MGPPPCHTPSFTSHFSPHRLVLPVLELAMKGITQNVLSSLCLPWLVPDSSFLSPGPCWVPSRQPPGLLIKVNPGPRVSPWSTWPHIWAWRDNTERHFVFVEQEPYRSAPSGQCVLMHQRLGAQEGLRPHPRLTVKENCFFPWFQPPGASDTRCVGVSHTDQFSSASWVPTPNGAAQTPWVKGSAPQMP